VDTGSEKIRFADLRVRMDQLKATGRWYFQFSLADLDAIEFNSLLGLRRRLVEKTSADELRRALVDFLTPHPDAVSSDNDPHSPNGLPPKNH
jgi:hypothetical protein